MALTQTHFRFRNDDGSETTATWMGVTNANQLFSDSDTTFRLRVAVIGGSGSDEEELGLQYRLNGGTWQTPSGTVLDSELSPHLAEGAATTQQITSGGFTAGIFDELNCGTDVPIAMGTDYTEVEFCLKMLAADVADGDVIEFRLTKTGGGALLAYSVTPTITVGVAFPVPDIPPDQTPAIIGRSASQRYAGMRGGHNIDYFEPMFFDAELTSIDRWQGHFQAVMLRRRYRPPTEYVLVDVPVPPDVVEHGWEFDHITHAYARWRAKRSFLAGSAIVPTSQDPLTTSYLTILGTTTIRPTYAGANGITPSYLGESSINAEGE